MGPCASEIRRHFMMVPKGSLVCRQHLLGYGSAGAVDMALRRCLASEYIIRVGPGTYARAISNVSDFTEFDVAKARAESFGRKVAVHPNTASEMLQLKHSKAEELVFATDRSSTRFLFKDRYIHLKLTSAKKHKLTDDRAGQAIKAMWQFGRENGEQKLSSNTYFQAVKDLRPEDIHFLFDRWDAMPAWLIQTIRQHTGTAWKWHARKFRVWSTPVENLKC
jgi:hypothetical protein